jgi:hypothetical protein
VTTPPIVSTGKRGMRAAWRQRGFLVGRFDRPEPAVPEEYLTDYRAGITAGRREREKTPDADE